MDKWILFLWMGFVFGCVQSDWTDFFYGPPPIELYLEDDNDSQTSDTCDLECEKNCAKIYESLSAEDECQQFSSKDVRDIQNVYERMKSGRWSSIHTPSLELMISISYEPWEKRAASSSGRIGRNMLVWVAELSEQDDGDISKLVTEDVLKESFFALGGSRNIRGIREALLLDLRTSNSEIQSFLEMLAWENNDKVFEKVHNVIQDECGSSSKICMIDTYCDHDEDIIYEKITDLELHEDFLDSSRFHKGFCSF